jgi:hypothetical protein
VSKCGEIIQYLKRKKNLISSLKKRENFKRKFLFEFLKLKFLQNFTTKIRIIGPESRLFQMPKLFGPHKRPYHCGNWAGWFWTWTIALDPTFGSFTLLESVSQ